jgi:N-acetylglucosaminyldiphosphoundecaprenol N-acetyl-beta-D-mannosaminyltransferase
MRTVPVLEIPFHALTEGETLTLLQSFLNEPRNHIIVTPNPEAVMQARRDASYKAILLDADLRLADGIGILLASYLQRGKPLPGRVRGVDTFYALMRALSGEKRATTVFLLGGAAGVAEAAKKNIEGKYPSVQVIGLCDGFLTPEKEIELVRRITALQPEILLVCMGMPRQERWAARHRALPVRLTFCLGGTIDILAGTVSLTPDWLRKIGLEWLHRLIRQPGRAKRMLDLPRFVLAVIKERLRF